MQIVSQIKYTQKIFKMEVKVCKYHKFGKNYLTNRAQWSNFKKTSLDKIHQSSPRIFNLKVLQNLVFFIERMSYDEGKHCDIKLYGHVTWKSRSCV